MLSATVFRPSTVDWVGWALTLAVALGTVLFEHRKLGELERTTEQSLRDSARRHEESLEATRRRGRLAPVYLPPRRTYAATRFVGRSELIGSVTSSFVLGPERVVVLCGGPGIGKSQIALRLALAFGPDSTNPLRGDGLLWAELGRDPKPDQLLAAWLASCETADERHASSADRPPPSDLQPYVSAALAGRHPLVVVDDVWSYEDAKPLIDAAYGCPVLVTTTDHDVGDSICEHHAGRSQQVPPLTPAEAHQLLAQVLDETALADAPRDFLARLAHRIEASGALDPFSVVQWGAHARDMLLHGDQHQGVDFEAVIRAPRSVVEDRPVDQAGHLGPTRGVEAYRYRLSLMGGQIPEPLLVLGMLRPQPESFSAKEVATFCGASGDDEVAKVAAVLDGLARRSFLDRSVSGPATPGPARSGAPRPGPPPEVTYSLHSVAKRALGAQTTQEQRQRFSEAVKHHWLSLVDPNYPGSQVPKGLTSYQSALHRESRTWLRAASNLLYHLASGDAHEARLTFDKVYFELFWWWGYYLQYDFLDQLVEEWLTMERPGTEADNRWARALELFHRSYQPAHDGTFPAKSNWRRNSWADVRLAVGDIMSIDGLDGPLGTPKSHAESHVRALCDIFLAHAHRFGDTGPGLVDQYYREARQLFERCGSSDQGPHLEGDLGDNCEWNLAWLDYEEADTALERSRLDQAIAKAATALGRLVGTTGAGAAQPPQREQIEDWELLALSCRVWGDALFAQGQFLEATARYKQATVLAFAWQYLQRTGPDRYTWAFYGDVVARLLERLEAVRTQGPATARQLVEHLVPLRDIVRLGPKRKRPRTDWGCLSRGPAFRDMVLDEVFDVRDPATVSSPHHHSPGLLDAVDEVLEQLHRDAVQPSGQAGSP